jgi:hypothetical protein
MSGSGNKIDGDTLFWCARKMRSLGGDGPAGRTGRKETTSDAPRGFSRFRRLNDENHHQSCRGGVPRRRHRARWRANDATARGRWRRPEGRRIATRAAAATQPSRSIADRRRRRANDATAGRGRRRAEGRHIATRAAAAAHSVAIETKHLKRGRGRCPRPSFCQTGAVMRNVTAETGCTSAGRPDRARTCVQVCASSINACFSFSILEFASWPYRLNALSASCGRPRPLFVSCPFGTRIPR